MVGGGALDAGPEVQAVAELLHAPVSSFRRGRGVIPTSHPLAVSFTEGHGLWKTADAVLAIGTRLYWQQSNWGVDDDLPVIRLDIDPDEIGRFRSPACALLGDAAVTLRALLAALRESKATWQPNPDLPAVRAAFAERLGRQEPPMGFLRAIRAALPEDGIYVEDVTQIGFASRLALPVLAASDVPVARVSGHAGMGIRHGAGGASGGARTESGAGDRRWRLHVPGDRAGDRDAPQAAGCGRGV